MPAAFLFFSVAMRFLHSSSVKANTSEESSLLTGDNLGHLRFVGISPLPLTCSWCATWLAVTRQGGFGVIGSLEIFLIVCHAFQLLPVRYVDVIISSHLLLFSVATLLISSLPGSCCQKGCSCTVSCMPHIGTSILQIDQESNVSYTPLVYVSSISDVWLQQTCHSSLK